MKKANAIFILTILISLPLFSANMKYDYNTMYSLMLQNNNRLGQADQTIYNTQLLVKDAKSLYQPNISYAMYGMYLANPPIGSISMNTGTLFQEAGLSNMLDAFGQIDATHAYVVNRIKQNLSNGQSISVYDGMAHSYYGASVSLTQPLITWGKIPLAVDFAKTASSVAELNKGDLLRQLETELNIRLYSLYYMDQLYALIDQAEKDSDELVSIAEQASENGVMSEQDVLDAKIQAQDVDVQRAELDSQYNDVLQGLRTLIGVNDLKAEDIEFTPDTAVLRKYENSDIWELKALATADSGYQLQMVNKVKSATKIEEDIAWRSTYGVPDVMLNVSAGYGGSKFPLFQDGWKDDDDWSVNVSVIVSGNIWDGGRRSNSIKKAKSSQASADISYDSAIETLESTVESNYNSMRLTLAKYDYQLLKKENESLKLDKIRVEAENGNKSKKDILNQEIEIITTDVEILTNEITLVNNVFMLDYLTNK